MDSGKQRGRSGGGDKRQIVKESFFVDGTNLVRILKECFDLRGKRKPPVMDAVVERLDTDPVTNKPEAMRVGVPEGNGEHSAEFLQAVYPPFRKSMQDHLCVG